MMKQIRNIFLNSKNQSYLRRFDLYPYLWFKFHKLFFGSLIFRGRKLWAFNFFLQLQYALKVKESVEPFWVFLLALMSISPALLLFPKKLGGSVAYVPMPIGERKQYTFAIKWVIKLLRNKNRSLTIADIVNSLVDGIYQQGDSYEYKLELYTKGMSNRHLIRYFRK